MNWCDEKYVKLYVRQTATWRLWPWEARCVLPLLLQVANGAGLIDVGSRAPLTGLSVLIMVPVEVVSPAIDALLADGTLEQVATGYLLPKYLEAQEAVKTDSRKKADQRDRERAKARGITKGPVTECHPVSPAVPLQPSPAQPSPAHKRLRAPKAPAAKEPVDPRHAPLRARLVAIFERVRESAYPFGPRDARTVKELLSTHEPDAIAGAWQRALQEKRYPLVSTLPELQRNLAHFVGTGAPVGGKEAFDPNQGIIRSTVSYPDNVNTYEARDQDPFPWGKS